MKQLSFLTVFLALFGAVCLTVVPSGSPFAADTIKLGVAGAHTGDLASYGLPTVKAAELVV
jgi:branched-chain amino acid transport system substrate-binding protein